MKYISAGTPQAKQKTEEVLSIFKNFEKTKISFDFKDVNNNYVYLTDDDVTGDGITVTTFLNPDNDMVFGKAVSTEVVAYFEKNTKTLSIDWSKGSTLYIKYYQNNTWYSITFAHFVGSEPKTVTYNDTEIFEFRSNDYMVKFDINADEFLDSITYPCSTNDIYLAVAAYLGITVYNTHITYGITINSDPFQRGCTLRDVLQYCAEFYGMYFIFDQVADYLTFQSFDRPLYGIEYKLTPDDYFEIRKSYIQVPSVPAIVYIDSNGRNLSYPSTYTGTPYVIYDNPLYKTMSDADIVTRLQYMKENFLTFESPYDEYYPLSVYAPGNPMVQVGDIIDVVDKDGNAYPNNDCKIELHVDGAELIAVDNADVLAHDVSHKSRVFSTYQGRMVAYIRRISDKSMVKVTATDCSSVAALKGAIEF